MTKKINPRFTITVSGKPQEIFMSFGRLNTLAAYFEHPDQLQELYINSQVRASVLVECLSQRDENGRIEKEFNLSLEQLEIDQVMELFAWVEEHLEDFFTKALARATNRLKKTTRQTT